MVTDDGQITNGGLLLCDQGVLKQSRIFCTRWKGNYKGSIEEDALDDKEFQGASPVSYTHLIGPFWNTILDKKKNGKVRNRTLPFWGMLHSSTVLFLSLIHI